MITIYVLFFKSFLCSEIKCEYYLYDETEYYSIMNAVCNTIEAISISPNDLLLNSSFNYNKVSIHGQNFQNLTEPILHNCSINELDLSNNRIRYISNRTFSLIYNIYNLDLSNNQLATLTIYDLYFNFLDYRTIEMKFDDNFYTKLMANSRAIMNKS